MRIFVEEIAKWFDSERDMMRHLLDHVYKLRDAGKVVRGISFYAQCSDGWSKKILFTFLGKEITKIEAKGSAKLLPNWLFPYMTTDKNNKNLFFHTREEMLQSLKDGVEYKLTTTSETLLNNKGLIGFFQIKKDGNILIVDGKNHKL